jgi:autotransporter adhesin
LGNSIAIGYQAKASEYSVNVGAISGTAGTGPFSIAAGYHTQAIGNRSIAIGGGDGQIADGTPNDGAVARDYFSVAIGSSAVAKGERSTSVGAYAGYGSNGANNNRNSAFGDEAGEFVKGGGNTGAGLAAGYTVTGDLNSAMGNSAGQFVTGNNNTADGVLAGRTVHGSSNTAIGNGAGNNVSGNGNVAIGWTAGRNTTASNTVAVGTGATATKADAVALGSGSIGNVANAVSVGHRNHERRIINVATAVDPTDAVNLGQVHALLKAAAVSAIVAPRRPPPEEAAIGSARSSAVHSAPPFGQWHRTGAATPAAMTSSGPRDERPATESEVLEPSTIVGWAKVSHDGKVTGSRNIVGNARHGVGNYEIVLKQASLQQCTYNATLHGMGFVAVSDGSLPNSLKIEIRNHYGTPVDAAFHLMVVC